MVPGWLGSQRRASQGRRGRSLNDAAPLGAADLIRTTGSIREFTDEPVADDVVRAVLDAARFAPSGGNRQPWRVVVVRDATIRRGLAGLMRPVWNEYVARQAGSPRAPFSDDTPAPADVSDVPNLLLDSIERIPVVLAVAADLRLVALMDRHLERPALTGGASIYPFCWSVLLAARTHGLGGVLTTFLSRAEVDAAPLLGLPPEHALAATIFLGHPVHRPTRLRRRPVEEFTTIDRFDGPSFPPA